jgi:DNA-binding NarL/FixJ family response regulator
VPDLLSLGIVGGLCSLSGFANERDLSYSTTKKNVSRRLLTTLANGEIASARSELTALSDRELQVFSLIGRGFGASRLATELHLSVKTIETYQAHIKEKLGLHSAGELSAKAARWMLHSMRRDRELRKLLKTAGTERRQIVNI